MGQWQEAPRKNLSSLELLGRPVGTRPLRCRDVMNGMMTILARAEVDWDATNATDTTIKYF